MRGGQIRKGLPMEYVIVSDQEDRVVKFGWARGKRYADEVVMGMDPWWDFHVIVKKPGIDIDFIGECVTEHELLDFITLIEKSRDFEWSKEETTYFMEPDCNFTVSKRHGIFQIYLKYTDSLCIWLEREHLDAIAEYLKKALQAP